MTSIITLGKAGRLVVPKALRELAGLQDGARLRLRAKAGKLEVAPEPEEVRIKIKGGFPVILGGPPRKQGDIVRAIKALREETPERLASRRKRA